MLCDRTQEVFKTTHNYRIPLSPYAAVFYNEWLINPHSYRYNMLCADHLLTGTLDPHRLTHALKHYVADHLLLNSHVQLFQTIPHWVKNDSVCAMSYREKPASEQTLFDFVARPFNLHQGPLYRFLLVKLPDHQHRFMVVLHHLLMDGISINSGVFAQISDYYNDLGSVKTIPLSDQIKQIDALQKKMHGYLQAHQTGFQRFWRKQLSDLEPLDLCFLKALSKPALAASFCNPIQEIRFSLKNQPATALKTLKARYHVSPYFFSQCVFAITLHRYTEQMAFAICYPISIRPGMDFIFGGQVNLTLMPYRFRKHITPCQLLQQISQTWAEIKAYPVGHYYYPVSNLMADDPGYKPLLSGYFAQTLFRDAVFTFQGITAVKSPHPLGLDGVTPDVLLIETDPSCPGRCRIRYDSRAMDPTCLHGFVQAYQKLYPEILADVLHGHHKPISDYTLLDPTQTQCALNRYLAPAIVPAASAASLHRIFEQQARAFKDQTAIVCQDRTLSYQTLNEKANQLAHYLQSYYQIQPDDRVVLCLEKDEHLVVALLAVLKSQGAYVPVADYPKNRIAYILKDTAPKCVIVSQKYQAKFQGVPHVLALDTANLQHQLSQQPSVNLPGNTQGHHLCYVLYTSGTTGQPKGVLQQHNNVLDLFSGTNSLYGFHNRDAWVLFHAAVFDFSVWELFGALLHGGKLVIPTPAEIQDPQLLYRLCHKQKVTVLNQTPTAFYPFIAVAKAYQADAPLAPLRYIIFGGETLDYGLLSEWFALYPEDKPSLINMYGITEACVHVTYQKISKRDCAAACGTSSIGVPFPGKAVYVLDSKHHPVPIGGQGELYCTGGVARGYLNQPQLTKARFIDNPFPHTPKHQRLYRSGDKVRVLPNGDLAHMGRSDDQIKIRGYRIETGEIIQALKCYKGVRWAGVRVHRDSTNTSSDAELIAYFMADEPVCKRALGAHMAQQLPGFMCPRVLIQISALPLTINGKIDVKALPAPCLSTQKPTPPQNAKERKVCEAFAQILGQKNIGIDDSFFDLGGNSIQAIRLTFLLQADLDIQVADVFALLTPRELAKKARKQQPPSGQLGAIKAYLQAKILAPQQTAFSDKKHAYLQQALTPKIAHFSLKPIKTVLLTGATGYLGAHLLHYLLCHTPYTIYVLVRASDKAQAQARISRIFSHYFDAPIAAHGSHRVVYMAGDLEKAQLGLDPDTYKTLVAGVDSILHAAALVKHQGAKQVFYDANVMATEHLLTLASLTRLQDFHYVSTCSVAFFGHLNPGKLRLFTESDPVEPAQNYEHIYNQTKYLGEQVTQKWRGRGLKTNIYRVGNLAFSSLGAKPPLNLTENAFANFLLFLMQLQAICPAIGTTCLSQTDQVARAIGLLFDKAELNDQTFHVFNPYPVDLYAAFQVAGMPLKKQNLDAFIATLRHYLQLHPDCLLLQLFLLYRGWMRKKPWDFGRVTILQDQSAHILKQLGFTWQKPSKQNLTHYLKKVYATQSA